jgi:ferredoxin
VIKEVRGIYFSPSGGTKAIVSSVAESISKEMDEMCLNDIKLEFMDVIKHPIDENIIFDQESIIVFGVPVFAGRVPLPCKDIIQRIQGNNALAVALVSYGNNTYGDALYELNGLLENQGFKVVSAGAFISGHSIFNKVAVGRPDKEDLNTMVKYGRLCANKLKRFATTDIEDLRAKLAPLKIKGSMPTKEPMKMPIRPTVGKGCLHCGVCALSCPTGAISMEDTSKVDTSKCVSCTTCIRVCPNNARGFHGPIVAASSLAFEKLCGKRKDPEWFI